MQLLLVNNCATFSMALQAILENSGYTNVLLKDSVETAMDYLQSHSTADGKTPVDLILMDMIMPGIDGIEAVKQIKAVDSLSDIPIVMIRDGDDDTKIEQAFDAGAIDYINKPIQKMELKAMVRAILKLKEERDQRRAHERQLELMNSRLETSNNELQRLAITDDLTAIANRRYFDEIFSKEWKRAFREKNPLSLILVDIDHFKAYNDLYGYVKGDQCLKSLAGAMDNAIRRAGDLLARYGGEQFIILLPGTDEEGVQLVAKKVQNQIGQLKIPHEQSVVHPFLTISIGIATTVPYTGQLLETLIQDAEEALGQAKDQGRNRIVAAGV